MNIQKFNNELCEKCVRLMNKQVDSHTFQEIEVFIFGIIFGVIGSILISALITK